MYVFDYLRFNFKTQDYSVTVTYMYVVTGMKNVEKREMCVHIVKCAKVRALFAERVRFAHAEQLCFISDL